jgi:hypothetical protein
MVQRTRSIHYSYLLYCSCNFVSWGGLDYLGLRIRGLKVCLAGKWGESHSSLAGSSEQLS